MISSNTANEQAKLLPEFKISQGAITYTTFFYKRKKRSSWIIRMSNPWTRSKETFYDCAYIMREWDTEQEAKDWLKGYLYGEENAEGQTLQEG